MEAHSDPAFWNQAAGRHFAHPLDVERLARMVSRDAAVLDYGCGPGRLCGELIEHGFTRVTGIDSSPGMIEAARASHPGANYLVNDGGSLPVADASFDVALLFAVLTCVPSDDAQKNLVAEFKRVLRPGGLLLISDYPLQSDARNLARYAEFEQLAGGHGIFRLPDGVTLRHHRREWFEELLADFRIEDARELEVLTMNGNPARILQFWARTPGDPNEGR